MFKHILIPTDGSGLSQQAAKAGVALAQALGAKITAVSAGNDSLLPVYTGWANWEFPSREGYLAGVEARSVRDLMFIEDEALRAGVPCQREIVFSASPSQAILKPAEEKECDLIFMASHGRHGIDALLVGSETNKVLVHAKIPVLVFRPTS